MARGMLITIEGRDGSGKTTLARALEPALQRPDRSVRLLREPGGVPASERIRDLVKDPGLTVSPRAEALLYAAARAQLVEEALEPLLSKGVWVLLDRFVDSSLAYQGAGRRLGVQEIRTLNQFATGGLTPDRTLLLTVTSGVAWSRTQTRGKEPDRLELEDEGFYERLAAAYEDLADAEPARVRRIDASASAETVLQAALDALSDLL